MNKYLWAIKASKPKKKQMSKPVKYTTKERAHIKITKAKAAASKKILRLKQHHKDAKLCLRLVTRLRFQNYWEAGEVAISKSLNAAIANTQEAVEEARRAKSLIGKEPKSKMVIASVRPAKKKVVR